MSECKWYMDSLEEFEKNLARLVAKNPECDIRTLDVGAEREDCPAEVSTWVYELLGSLIGLVHSTQCIPPEDLPALEARLQRIFDEADSAGTPHLYPRTALFQALRAVKSAHPDRAGPPPGPSCS